MWGKQFSLYLVVTDPACIPCSSDKTPALWTSRRTIDVDNPSNNIRRTKPTVHLFLSDQSLMPPPPPVGIKTKLLLFSLSSDVFFSLVSLTHANGLDFKLDVSCPSSTIPYGSDGKSPTDLTYCPPALKRQISKATTSTRGHKDKIVTVSGLSDVSFSPASLPHANRTFF